MEIGPNSSASAHPSLREPVNRVDPRAKKLWRIVPLACGVPVVIGALIALPFAENYWWIPLLIVVAALLALVFYVAVVPAWRYRFHRWEVSDDAVYTQSGWFSRHAVIIPIARIQVVDTEAGPLEQLLKLATLTVTTASSAGTVRIVGLDAAVAKQTAADLTIATGGHTGDAT
ncbi:PH domain-containing protein [Gordonia amarae]|uniref:YdbS-like PH domain-containing protein n=2 Tax=Gordonia amarae TaxID=36821 RepID=G7GQK4_9ACTN|nr:PH domain-containing protein [Gordonia amarae]MCS3880199.1 membrane protein YdbS with pleckstrin-like domain [Gordonia amarae]QHN18557.1 PH domain-containing protein [Gordonia amarae]QHN23040.1 PH domain-containing protein [Gordonia amarae]QHN31941.1 PH domain-containing protein [Gordonia amarae]QHN40688.1 PH domain-containing protein [Gordonia amarae]